MVGDLYAIGCLIRWLLSLCVLLDAKMPDCFNAAVYRNPEFRAAQ